MISIEKLTEFSSNTNTDDLCAAPFQHAGRAYATNRHICIELQDADPTLRTIARKFDAIANLLKTHEAGFEIAGFKPLEGIPEKIDCRSCNGTGTALECRHCEGDGYIRDKDDPCEHCDGVGETQKEKDEYPLGLIPCWFCDGNGEEEQAIDIGHGRFNAHYLRLIASLPNASFAPNPINPAAGAALFVFDGGRGALMPLRK